MQIRNENQFVAAFKRAVNKLRALNLNVVPNT